MDATIKENEIVDILGRNGAGKSTLLNNLTDGQTNDMMLYRSFSPTLVVYTKERLE